MERLIPDTPLQCPFRIIHVVLPLPEKPRVLDDRQFGSQMIFGKFPSPLSYRNIFLQQKDITDYGLSKNLPEQKMSKTFPGGLEGSGEHLPRSQANP